MLMVGIAVQGTVVLPRTSAAISRFLPDAEGEVDRELPRMFLRFLGVEE